jgi:transcriptional regulator of acetoin/glycerol metabolism
MNPSVELQARLQTVRSHYRVTPWIQPREDESPLMRSWQRCRDAGMREHESVNFELVSRTLLAELDEVHGGLVQAARPETERLARAMRGTGCVVLLFNTRGVVIDRLCHDAGTAALLLAASRKGVNLAERCVGTTAPAISLADGLPYLVGRDAHFFANVRSFFCAAAPIDSPTGERLGALDITGYDNVPSFDIYSLVIDAAAAIENSLFRPTSDRLVVRFHPRGELVGTALEGLLEVGSDGLVCGANRAAARLLCLPRAALLGRAFAALFDRRLQALFARPQGQHSDLVEMLTHVGLQVLARFESEPRRASLAGSWSGAAASADTAPSRDAGDGHSLPGPAERLPANLRELERQAIARTLATVEGNVSAAARQLGISRNTIYRRRSEPAD